MLFRSGKTLLTALVTGYEVAARLGMAFTPRPLAHQNGQAMLLAAAAAGARMRGLDAAGISLAMRISAVMLMTPSYTNTGAGSSPPSRYIRAGNFTPSGISRTRSRTC